MEPNLPFKVITMKNMQMVPSYVECNAYVTTILHTNFRNLQQDFLYQQQSA